MVKIAKEVVMSANRKIPVGFIVGFSVQAMLTLYLNSRLDDLFSQLILIPLLLCLSGYAWLRAVDN